MSRIFSLLSGAIAVALLMTVNAFAQLDNIADEYVVVSGYGLTAERISNPAGTGGDYLRDLIVTDLYDESYCFVNLNASTPPYFDFHPSITVSPGRQALFGLLRPDQP